MPGPAHPFGGIERGPERKRAAVTREPRREPPAGRYVRLFGAERAAAELGEREIAPRVRAAAAGAGPAPGLLFTHCKESPYGVPR